MRRAGQGGGGRNGASLEGMPDSGRLSIWGEMGEVPTGCGGQVGPGEALYEGREVSSARRYAARRKPQELGLCLKGNGTQWTPGEE